MSKIFISYRRSDAGYQPEIIKNTLSKFVDEEIIFYDHDIASGDDFVEVINNRLESAKVMLVIIGKDWLDILKSREKDKNAVDFVKFEIEQGLKKDELDGEFTLIPVLFEGAKMPSHEDLPASMKKLSNLNALTIGQNGLEEKLTELGISLCKKLNGPLVCGLKRFKYHILATMALIVGGYFGANTLINKASCDPFSDLGDIKILIASDHEDQEKTLSDQIIKGLKPFESNLKLMDGKTKDLDPGDLMNMSINCGTEVLVDGRNNGCLISVYDSKLSNYIYTQYNIAPEKIRSAYENIPRMTCILRNFIAETKNKTDNINAAYCFIDGEISDKDTLGMILSQSTANILEKQGKLDSALVILEKLSTSGGVNPDTVYARMERIASTTKNTSAEIIAKTGLIKQAEKKGDIQKSNILKTQIVKLETKLNVDQGKVQPVNPNSKLQPSSSKPTSVINKVQTKPTVNTGIKDVKPSSTGASTYVPVQELNVNMYNNLNKLINSGNYLKIEDIYQKNKLRIDNDPALSALYYESMYKAKKISDTLIPVKMMDYNARLKTDVMIQKILKKQ